jgi:uncharacterized protein YlxW (UPF0749 family)
MPAITKKTAAPKALKKRLQTSLDKLQEKLKKLEAERTEIEAKLAAVDEPAAEPAAEEPETKSD